MDVAHRHAKLSGMAFLSLAFHARHTLLTMSRLVRERFPSEATVMDFEFDALLADMPTLDFPCSSGIMEEYD